MSNLTLSSSAQSPIEITIVTPVFNRVNDILASIQSSLSFLGESGFLGEIILVDDASSDGSADAVLERYSEVIHAGIIYVVRLPSNCGPTGAKQAGAERARGNWIIFMDSDDFFVTGVGADFRTTLELTPPLCPIVFFRCIDKVRGELIGSAEKVTRELDFNYYLANGTPGECLPVVRREYLLKVPYVEDLRGFEQITYASLIQKFGSAWIVPLAARIYCTTEDGDRLSTKYALRRRGCLLARGYFRMLMKFGFRLRWRIPSTVSRILYHMFNCIIFANFIAKSIDKQ